MSSQYALYLSDATVIFGAVDVGGVQPIFSSGLSGKESVAELKQFLERQQPDVIKVFVDVMGEEFKHESIPHIGSKDRDLLLARKMKTLFPVADLTWRKHLRREKEGRKDDVYLLAGVPLHESIKKVLDMLIQIQQKVSGIYSISILEQLIKPSLTTSKEHLVVSRVLSSQKEKKSYRQTFYKNNELVISRVTNVSIKSDVELYQQMLSEIERMHQFLNVTRQLDEGGPLQVVTLLSDAEVSGLKECASGSAFDFSYTDLSELVENKGIKKSTQVPPSLAELLIYLSIQKKEKPHFQPENLCASYKFGSTKKSLITTSVIAVALSLLLSTGVWFKANSQSNNLDVLNAEVQQLRVHKNKLASEALETDLPVVQMNQVVELYNKLAANRNVPEYVLPIIAKAYAGYSAISIDKVTWLGSGSDTRKVQSQSLVDQLEKPKQYRLGLSFPRTMSNRGTLSLLDSFSGALMHQKEIVQVEIEESAIDTRVTGQMAETMGVDSIMKRNTQFTLLITM